MGYSLSLKCSLPRFLHAPLFYLLQVFPQISLTLLVYINQTAAVWVGSRLQSVSDLASRSPQWQFQPPENFGNSEKWQHLWLWVFSLFRHIQVRELEPCEQDSVFRAGRSEAGPQGYCQVHEHRKGNGALGKATKVEAQVFSLMVGEHRQLAGGPTVQSFS